MSSKVFVSAVRHPRQHPQPPTAAEQLPISLHAGELGHAQRTGHGVDVIYEGNAPGLLKELAQNHVMVEINLSSNEGILGIEGDNHPFPIYRTNHVPLALSTDDEGVSRIDITHQYVRAAIDYNLTYQDIKRLARTGMEHDSSPAPASGHSPTSSPARPPRASPTPSARMSPRPPASPSSTPARKPRPNTGAGAPLPPLRLEILKSSTF